MKEDVRKALIELGLLSAHVVNHPECAREIERDARELVSQHRENAEYALLKIKVPISMYEAFEKACARFEGRNVDSRIVSEYVQSVVFKAFQDFIKQYEQV